MKCIAFLVILAGFAAYFLLDVGSNGNYVYTTAEEVAKGISLTGKVAVVTGSNSGIGWDTARVLALKGAKVIVTARSLSKATKAAESIRAAHSGTSIDLIPMEVDLESLISVKKFANNFLKMNLPLHMLILNAGVMAIQERTTTKFEVESQIGVNHVAHTYLATLLAEKLVESAPSRLVSVSSVAEAFADTSFLDSANLENSYYHPWIAYGNSKMANILFAKEFNARYSHKGVTAVSLHPGSIMTNLQQHVLGWQRTVMTIFGRLFFKTTSQGAATSIYAATSPEITERNLGGTFLANAHESSSVHPAYIEKDVNGVFSKKLWDDTEALIKKGLELEKGSEN